MKLIKAATFSVRCGKVFDCFLIALIVTIRNAARQRNTDVTIVYDDQVNTSYTTQTNKSFKL